MFSYIFIHIIQIALFSSEFLPASGKYSLLKRNNIIMRIKNITKHKTYLQMLGNSFSNPLKYLIDRVP